MDLNRFGASQLNRFNRQAALKASIRATSALNNCEYLIAALVLLLSVFLRGGHYRIFFLGLVNGAVLAFCYCLRDAPRKTYHLSQP